MSMSKTVFYRSNGTGRDTYITTDNGGGVKKPHFKTQTRPQSSLDSKRLIRANQDSKANETSFCIKNS
jgi:hypothetical protein